MPLQTWTNITRRDGDFGNHAWFSCQKRLKDRQWYTYGGQTNLSNVIQRWDPFAGGDNPPKGSWVIEKARSVNPDCTAGANGVFTVGGINEVFHNDGTAGGLWPGGDDNGFCVWDNKGDELWVSSVNICGSVSGLGIYSPTTQAWRAATTATYPDLLQAVADGGGRSLYYHLTHDFNIGVASSPTTVVWYGPGTGGATGQTDLFVFIPANAQNSQFKAFPDHGSAAGVPGAGTTGGFQSQFRWVPFLGKYVLYSNGQFWTLTEGTITGGWTWAAVTTTGSTVGMPVTAACLIDLEECHRLVVTCNTGDVTGASAVDAGATWVIDYTVTPWTITKLAMSGTPPWPRRDGIAWNVLNTIYTDWGQEQVGAGPWQSPTVPAISGAMREVWQADGIATLLVPTGSWLALPHAAATPGWQGTGINIKHSQFNNGPNSRLYHIGGDFTTAGRNSSYRQDMYSFSLATELAGARGDGWRQEQAYCLGALQNKWPDKTSPSWDSGRGVIWSVPGDSQFSAQAGDICTGETGAIGSDLNFRWNEILQWNPTTGVWTQYDDHAGPGYAFNPNQHTGGYISTYSVYDSAGDQIIRIAGQHSTFGIRMQHYALATKVWTEFPTPPAGWVDGTTGPDQVVSTSGAGTEIYAEQGYVCIDSADRLIFFVSTQTGRAYEYAIATNTLTRRQNIPGGANVDATQQEWSFVRYDDTNKKVIFYRRYAGSGGATDIRAYAFDNDPLSGTYRTWLTLAMTCNFPLVVPDGNILVYDTANNAVLLWGSDSITSPGSPTGTRYLFVMRYGGAAPPPPPPPTTPVLTSLSLSSCVPGDTMTCTGTDLNQTSATIRVEGVTVVPSTITATQMVFTVPNLPSGTYRCWVSSPTNESNKLTFVIQYLNRYIHAIPFIGVLPPAGGPGG